MNNTPISTRLAKVEVPPAMRTQIKALTGYGFERCTSVEDLITQLGRSVGLLKFRNHQLQTRLSRAKREYEFARLEVKTWKSKHEN